MPEEIDVQQVQQLIAEEHAQLIDVLPPREYAQLHLPGALNLPLKRLTQETAGVLPPNRPLVAYCHDGQ